MSERSASAGLLRRPTRSAGRAGVARPREVGEVDEATRALVAAVHRRLRRRFGNRLKGLILFGSRARGDHRADSDADLAVVLTGPVARTFPIKGVIIDETYDLFLKSGILIQPWPLDEAWLHHPDAAPYPHIVKSVLHEGIDW